jgi:hypothetical protein
MLLSARPLQDVASVNSFEASTQHSFTNGDSLTLYFMLIDTTLDTTAHGYNPAGRRFIPATGSSLQLILENVDDAKKITRYATQPFPGDGSIWALDILASDKIKGTPQMRMVLTQPGPIITRGVLKNGIKIFPKENL